MTNRGCRKRKNRPRKRSRPKKAQQMKILIVDDSTNARQVLEFQLTRPGIGLTFAENGLQAVELNQSVKPDIILMDYHMPVLNGLEAIREIMRSYPTPIVVFTSDFTGKNVTDCINAGAVNVIDKPTMDWSVVEIDNFIEELRYYAKTQLPRYV